VGSLIDTNLCIAVEGGTLGADDIHEMTKQAPIYLSPVNVAEIRYGIELMKDDKQKQRAMSTLRRIRREPLLRITREVGMVFICRRMTVRQPVRLSSGSNAMKLSIA